VSFARLHKVITYAIAALGLYALTLGGDLDELAVALTALGFVVSWFVEAPLFERPAWTRSWNAVLVAALAIQVVRGVLGDSLLALGVEFAALLQITRLMNRRSARDYQQIAVLALLHLIAATVLSTEIGYAFIFVGFVVVTPWMLALSQLRREIEGNYPGVVPRSGPDVRRVLSSRRVVGPGFLIGTALLTMPIFATTVLLFVLFPRVGLGFITFGQGSAEHIVGFGRTVELGGFGTLRDNPTVVLRATLPDLPPDPPEHIQLRMRGTSFDYYDGRRWTRTASEPDSIGRMDDYYDIVRWPRPSDRDIRIALDPLDEPVIFLPEGTVGLTIAGRTRDGVRVGRTIQRSRGLDFRYIDADDLGLRYTAHVGRGDAELMIEPLDEAERALYLVLPPETGRIRALTEQITAGATTDRERADRVLEWLRDSGRFVYSLELPDTRSADPLEVFLFEARSGHCEYFSSAMAVMLRTIGIPTRNVTGFLGGRYNPYGGYYAIRQGDAHSWLEVYLDGAWTTYDPTPSASRNAVTDSWFDELRAFFDALRSRWSEDIVGYDIESQISGLRRLWTLWNEIKGDDSPDPIRDEAPSEDETTSVLPPALLAVAVAAALVALVWFMRRRKKSGGTRGGTDERAAAIYRELEAVLAKRGRARPTATTPREHARMLAAESFPGADEIGAITDRYERARFGAIALDEGDLASLRALIAKVKLAGKAGSPAQRSG
jgi:transglutaminase-like putative cysteine protease